MPTIIRLTTMPGKIQKGRHFDMLVLDLFGPSLGQHDISIRKPAEVAPAVRDFGERIRAAHPDASFKINVTVQKGQRKPPGYDAAQKAGDFKDQAFMHPDAKDARPIAVPTTAEVVS